MQRFRGGFPATIDAKGRVKLPPGVTTDDVMRELRGRAPGDPYPPPDDERG